MRFQNCELLFDITRFFSIGYIGEECSNLGLRAEIRKTLQIFICLKTVIIIAIKFVVYCIRCVNVMMIFVSG